MTKLCSKCKKKKDVSEFGKRKNRPDGLSFYCKACNIEYDNAHARRYRDRVAVTILISRSNKNFVWEWAYREGVNPSDLLYEEFCTVILNEQARQNKELEKKLAAAEVPVETLKLDPSTKLCTKCKKIKNRSEFWISLKSKDGLKSWCGDCMKAYKATKTYKTTTSYTED